MSNTLSHRLRPALQTGLTAVGSSQATAFALTNNTLHEFTTVASSTGAILPVGVTPSEVTIYNSGANALTLYPPLGGSIDVGSANASVSLAAGSGATFWASTPSNWYYLVTPGEGGGGSVTLTGAVTGTGTGTIATTIPNVSPPTTGPTRFLSGPFINVLTAGNAIANTTTATSIFTGATFRSGQSLTIPANSLIAGQAIRFNLVGTFGVSGAGVNFTLSILLGGTTVAKTQTNGFAGGATAMQWLLGPPTQVWFPAVGSSGLYMGYGTWQGVLSATANSVQAWSLCNGFGVGGGAMNSIDTTPALALDVQIQWGTASASDTYQLLGGNIEIVG